MANQFDRVLSTHVLRHTDINNDILGKGEAMKRQHIQKQLETKMLQRKDRNRNFHSNIRKEDKCNNRCMGWVVERTVFDLLIVRRRPSFPLGEQRRWFCDGHLSADLVVMKKISCECEVAIIAVLAQLGASPLEMTKGMLVSNSSEGDPLAKCYSNCCVNDIASLTDMAFCDAASNEVVSDCRSDFFKDLRSALPRYRLPRPTLFEDELAVNERLTNGERLLEDQIYGPESIAVNKNTGLVYTGLRTGLICEIDLSGEPKIIRAVRLTSHENCDGSYHSMPKCGRPLGMRFHPQTGELLVLDAYLGLFSIEWDTGALRSYILYSDSKKISVSRYLNDFDFLPDGRLVISESSTKFDDRDFIYDLLEHRPNGRILEYNLASDKLSVLVTNLYFPNGVQVVQGKVLIAEMGNARILKQQTYPVFEKAQVKRRRRINVGCSRYSPSSGNVDVLVDNLPGYPDNIRVSGDGAVWVPLAATRSENDNWLAVRPRLRALLTRLLSSQFVQAIADWMTSKYGLILKVDPESGKLLESFHDRTGHISEVSVAVEDGRGNLLMGSDVQCHIGRIKL
uniref:Str_synth domain-containing protein n=1 Tax=Angiostrongylus cantonensis TaxID=6313 RepID=A0A158P903_ANGCA